MKMKKLTKSKRAGILNQVVVHIVIIGIIFAIFIFATAGKVNARDFRQQVIEKQIALLIASSEPGFSFEVNKVNLGGEINSIEIKEGSVFVMVDGLRSVKGYPYFSPYRVSVEDLGNKFLIKIR